MDPSHVTPDPADLASQIRLLLDEREILRTLYQYGHSIDYKLEQDYLDCYTADGVFDVRRRAGPVQGHREAGQAQLATYIAGHGGAPERWHKHMLMEPVITIDGDSARARSYWMRIDAAEDGTPYIMGFGRYLDTLTREADGRWRFVERVAEVEGVHPTRDSRLSHT
ncbi:MAG: nuclear transport factor 2 family protein [Acidimicrobiia bacterium]